MNGTSIIDNATLIPLGVVVSVNIGLIVVIIKLTVVLQKVDKRLERLEEDAWVSWTAADQNLYAMKSERLNDGFKSPDALQIHRDRVMSRRKGDQ